MGPADPASVGPATQLAVFGQFLPLGLPMAHCPCSMRQWACLRDRRERARVVGGLFDASQAMRTVARFSPRPVCRIAPMLH
jgi:hypothetical protein